jgi:hypothetical protein
MGTKPIYKMLWFEQRQVTDNVQTSAKERMKIKVFRVVMLCLWVSFPELLKTLDAESSAFLQISKPLNSETATQ